MHTPALVKLLLIAATCPPLCTAHFHEDLSGAQERQRYRMYIGGDTLAYNDIALIPPPAWPEKSAISHGERYNFARRP